MLEDHDKENNASFTAGDASTILARIKEGVAANRYDTRSFWYGREHDQIAHFAFLNGDNSAINQPIDRTRLQRPVCDRGR